MEDNPFEHLVPKSNPDNPFDKFVPEETKRREKTFEDVEQGARAVNNFLPGKLTQNSFNAILPEAVTQYVKPFTYVADEALKQYGNALYGAARGIPVAGPMIDEAAGGLTELLAGDYQKGANFIKGLDDASEKDYPAANLYGKLAGGLTGGYGIGSKVMTKGAPAAWNFIKGVAGGTALGAAHEFGEGEDIKDRLDKAESGAKWGAAFTFGAPVIGSVLTPAARVGSRIIPTKFKRAFADEQILKAMESADLTPKQAFQKYNQGQKNRRLHSGSYAESPVALVDLSGSLGDLGRTVTTNPGPARKIAGEFLENRQIKQNDRINDALERGLRQKSKDGYYKTKGKLIDEQRELSKPAYDKAYQNAKSVRIDDLVDKWMVRADETSLTIGKKMKAAIKDVARVSGINNPARALKILDGAKLGLDDAISKARIKSPNLARELTKMKQELLSRVDGANPDYKSARAIYSSRAELLDAQVVGREFTKGDYELTAKAFKELSEPEKEMFRKGVMQELKKKMGDKQFTHDRTSLFNTPNSREVLKVVFQGNTKKFKPYQQFIDLMDTERQFVKTRNKIMGGSPTAPRWAELSEYGVDVINDVSNQFRSGNWAQAALGWTAKKVGEFYSFGKRDSEEIAKILFNNNPSDITKTLRRLHRKYGETKTRNMIQEVGEQWEKIGLAGQFGVNAGVSN